MAWSPALHDARPAGSRLSVEDWASWPPDRPGEVRAGHGEEEEAPDPIHELAVSWLIERLRRWLRESHEGRGFVFGSELKLVMSPELGRKADVVVVLPGSAPPPRRDRVHKVDEYAAFGVPSYWIVDPALGSVEVLELRDGRYTRATAGTAGVLSELPGCAGLTLDLDALWAELDRCWPRSPPHAGLPPERMRALVSRTSERVTSSSVSWGPDGGQRPWRRRPSDLL